MLLPMLTPLASPMFPPLGIAIASIAFTMAYAIINH